MQTILNQVCLQARHTECPNKPEIQGVRISQTYRVSRKPDIQGVQMNMTILGIQGVSLNMTLLNRGFQTRHTGHVYF